MRWNDRVYGEVAIDDPGILALIETPTFRRLRGIRQAGPSALAFPFKVVTRHEHSLGVFHLLGRLGAGRRECVAGLLHDLSHTAFSHAVDFVFASDEQDHHEGLKPEFLNRPDVVEALGAIGFRPEEFFDDSIYPLLERPIPWLCADRVDYFLRDGLACRVIEPDEARRMLGHLTVRDATIAFNDATIAREAVALFEVMNRDWWASPTEAFIYNEFADAIHAAFDLGVLDRDDLLTDDATVLAKLRSSDAPGVIGPLDRIVRFRPDGLEDYRPRIVPKRRWLDPPLVTPRGLRRLSDIPS